MAGRSGAPMLTSTIMRRIYSLLLASAAMGAAFHPAHAQKFIPRAILFHGDPEYTSQELLAAAGLKKGELLDFAAMGGYSQRLLASGVFATVGFEFDGQDLIFSLAPSPDLYPIRLDNLPLAPDADVDRALRQQLPLYHGKVPADGGLADDVRAALEKMLASEGVTATVTATAAANLATHKLNAVVYSITAPAVLIGNVALQGVSAQFEPALRGALAEVAKNPFDTENSAANLSRAVEQFYRDRGYAAVKVETERSGALSAAADGIRVPFSVSVEEGRVYKLAAIHLPDGAPVTQADIDKLLASQSGAGLEGARIRSVWGLLLQRYKAQGHLDCTIAPRPQLDDAAGTVSYTVDVNPGPVYHLGFVRFDNVSDQMRALLMHYWQMMPGDVFDESYVASFILKAQLQDPVLRRSLAGVKANIDATEDPQTHDVNVVIRLSH